ncbi:ACT domain-containing protein [Rhizobium phaseoli]|uniref:ACT domain-containing protein n=1 Tax=Rhizobium phaseoli TaxID=396 RepID=UPI0007EB796B|nr:ACT domain-containing protein [Rhizobium phaseoli]ANM04994.1 ACT domain-containing protein [Rhizobium phaseoli]
MAGVTDLATLLATMDPVLQEGEFAFCTLSEEAFATSQPLEPLGLFREAEGVTVILPVEVAVERGFVIGTPLRWITLNVHSALEAVGLTAAFATALTREGISANVVAGYYHDHIFLPAADATRAIKALKALSADT